VRYNISQNDKGRLLSIRYGFTSAYIYNNVFYIPAHLSPTIIHEALKQGTAQEYYFYNNIIYNLSPTAVYDWYQSVRHIDNNVFYGYHPVGEPADANKMTFDPLFVAPGTAGFGIDSVDGYKLSANSPCIDAGLVIANNGGRDYWGNTVPYGSKPDVGAHEWSGDTAAKYFDGLDIGSVGIGGSFSEGDGFCSVTGSGEGVGGSEDEFYFVHREMDGNEEYVAQITDFNGTDSNSVAGLMMREDFSGLSSFAAVVLDGDGDVRLVWTEAGENTYQQIFFDGFAACFANWTNGGAYCSATCYPGDDLSCKMNNTEYAIHEEDTSGYDGIILKYARYSDFDTGTLFSEWYDGTDWHVIEQVTGGYEWQIEEFALPVGASDNPSFAIRFRVDDGGGSGFAYVDLVEIGTGTEPRQVNSSAGVSATIPCWVRLKKLCDNYAGSISTDGVNWTSLGEATIDMGRDIYAGMAVSSGSDSYTCKADFDNVLFDFVGDLDSDDDVDGFDLDSFAGQWLNSCAGPGWCGGSDMNEDGTVDMIDYAVLAYDWLIER